MNLSFILKKSPAFIFDYLTDMQQFAAIHPVISQIDKISDENYLVHETLKFGFIPFSFTYPVTIKKNEIDFIVTIRAIVFKITKIEMKFMLKAAGNFTIVEEQIQFKSPWPIKFMMERIFRKQHQQLFKNMEMKTH